MPLLACSGLVSVSAKIVRAEEQMEGLDGRSRVKWLFRRNKPPWVRVWDVKNMRLVFCMFLCCCLRPSFCEVLWREFAVFLGWERGLLEELCIRSFYCENREAGWGEEVLWVWFWFFSFDQLVPSKQYGLIYLSELCHWYSIYLQKKCSWSCHRYKKCFSILSTCPSSVLP